MPMTLAFEVAAPEIFAAAAPEAFAFAPEAFYGGMEFGVPEMFGAGAEFGTAGLLGEYAMNEGILSALGAGGAEVPITQANMAADVLGGGAGAGAEGVNAAQVAAEQNAAQQVANSGNQFSQAELEALQRGQEMARVSSAAPPTEVTAGLNTKGTMYEGTFLDKFNNPSSVTDEALRAGYGSAPPAAPPVTTPAPTPAPVDYGLMKTQGINAPLNTASPSPYSLGNQYGNYSLAQSVPSPAATATANPAPSGLEAGFKKALEFVKESPFSAGSMALNAIQYLGKKEKEGAGAPGEYNGILSKYKMSPDFQGRFANPADYQYTPKVYNMAEGGIASYKEGDLVGRSAMDYYDRMTKPTAPPAHGDVGIYYDLDPDTRYQDALTAAQIRMAKVAKRANMQIPNAKRPTPMGQLNLAPPGIKAQEAAPMTEAAHGGIMHTSLGGYAAGGNPRLLKGPGDGMSDNIPATIADKQPARLADGEFVIPADVVSHLGNGSTEAGAKVLHEMMTKVRKERTGNPKQGKQINPNKFTPK